MEWDITGDVSNEIVDTEQLCYKYIDTDLTRKGCMALVCRCVQFFRVLHSMLFLRVLNKREVCDLHAALDPMGEMGKHRFPNCIYTL